MTPADQALDLLREILEDVVKWEHDDEVGFSELGARALEKWEPAAKAILAEVEAAAKARRG